MNLLVVLLTGSVGAAVVALIDHLIIWRLNRKEKEKDDNKLSEAEMGKAIKALRAGQRVILHDRIKYLCLCFIRDGEISFDDRRDLTEMHSIYHNDLGGNGHLDHLMAEAMKLPLKGD